MTKPKMFAMTIFTDRGCWWDSLWWIGSRPHVFPLIKNYTFHQRTLQPTLKTLYWDLSLYCLITIVLNFCLSLLF